jgi:branched-chain amino acid transport system ATP-binding protein
LPLRITGARKAFGGVVAVGGVDLEVSPGEAVAVIGPNGAGKSTLLKLVAGVHRPDAGEIRLGDRRLDRLAAHQVTRSGVALAHQVPQPFIAMTVLQNIQVGAMAARPGLSPGELTSLLDLCGLAGKARRPAGSLGVLDLKRLEVARALATRPQVLMLDEVAAGLVGRELDQAIEMIRRIHRTGVSLVLVEHIERVVREIVGRVLVLDWGKPIASGTPEEVARNAQVRAVYLGDGQNTARRPDVRPQPVPGQPAALAVQNLTAGYGNMTALRDVSFSIGVGEIVAVLGANGAGKSTLCGAIMGTVPPSSGSVAAFGTLMTGRPVHERARSGVAYCQEGRRVFGGLTVAENLALGAPLSLPAPELSERLARVHDTFPVLADRSGQRAGTLSGGQQQMLAVGRALMARPRLLICDEISLGLAPLAVETLYNALGAINAQGVAILLVEQNVHRSLELADHAVVLSRGRVTYAGDPQPLLNDANLDAAYFGHQSAHDNSSNLKE